MFFYNHVPFAVFESVPWNPLLYSKLTLREGQGDWWDSQLGQHYVVAAHWVHLSLCAPCVHQEMRALSSLGYLFLCISQVLAGSWSPAKHVSWWTHFSLLPKEAKTRAVQRGLSKQLGRCYWYCLGEQRSIMTRDPKRKTAGAIINNP